MLKHLMNGGSILSYALYDGNDDDGTPDPKAVLREKLAKGNLPEGENNEQAGDDKSDNEGDGDEEGDEEDEDEEGEEDKEEDDGKVEETEEQKKEREAKEKADAKLARKNDRMQRRIDEAIAAKKTAEDALAAFKAANPDTKLTEAEVEEKAEAIAAKKLAEKQLKDIQDKFDAACETLQKGALKHDKEFNTKINAIAEDIGPIPSFMIGVLEDFDNGSEVLAHIANDEELAEELWDLKNRPAKMTKKLVEISNKLEEAKRPPKKEISKVKAPGEPVKGNRVVSNTITEADAKNMEVYTRKRMAQMMEKRKAQGF